MKKNYTVIIISLEKENELLINRFNNTNLDYLLINKEVTIIDNNSLYYNDNILFFDYLIIQNNFNIKNLHIETDSKLAITNAVMQTSIENFFAIKPFNHCLKPLEKQVDLIIEYILNPY